MSTKKLVQPRSLSLPANAFSLTGNVSPAEARALLKVNFSDEAHARMKELSERARAGKLSGKEDTELTTFEKMGCFLDVVHSLARQALRKRRTAS